MQYEKRLLGLALMLVASFAYAQLDPPTRPRTLQLFIGEGPSTVIIYDESSGAVSTADIGDSGTYTARPLTSNSYPPNTRLAIQGPYTVRLDPHMRLLTASIGSKPLLIENVDDPAAIRSIDVASDGEIAIATDSTIVRRTRDHRTRPALKCSNCRISQVRYDGSSIYAYDSQSRNILAADSWSTYLTPVLNLSSVGYEPLDFVSVQGVIYACGGNHLSIATRRSKEITTLLLPNINAVARIAATSERIVMLSNDGNVSIRSRPIPITLRFDGEPPRTAAAIATLYSYLLRKQLLPTRDSTTPSTLALTEYVTLSHVLPVPATDASTLSTISAVIAQLNSNIQVPWYRSIGGAELPLGTHVTLPSVPFTSYLAVQSVELGTTTVDEYLQSRIPSIDDRRQVTREYLASLNGIDLESDLEAVAKTKGYVLLPVTRWRATILVDASEISDPSSDLRQFLNIYSVRILSENETHSAASSCTAGTTMVASVADVQINRTHLRDAINFETPATGLEPVTVGIAEEVASVDRAHPDFFDNSGRSIWQVNSAMTGLDADASVHPEQTPVSIRPFHREDHGTHVAGIIAARGTTAPGLAQNAKLYLLDATHPSADAMESAISEATKRGVRLFNFSNVFNGTDPTWDTVREAIWPGSRALYIVAAGNEGTSLDEQSSSIAAPLRWASLPNVIGVGATNNCEDVLGDIVEQDGIVAGSNHGAAYVHLIAPGLNVFSCAREAAYAPGCGTSDAAPQVTAAAAILMGLRVREPSIVKARLMYTADWRSQYVGKVLGGRLNVHRAVSNLHENVVSLESEHGVAYAFSFDSTVPAVVQLLEHTARRIPLSDKTAVPKEIPFRNVLRLQRQANQRYRIVYLEEQQGRLVYRTLYDAALPNTSLTIPCLQLRVTEPASRAGEAPPPEQCKGGVVVQQISDYVAELPPTAIDFQ
jgi:subtilisin family serine protease